ncbi:MAG: hypothetical protein Q9187_006950 [Circinaria calcarea]
MRIAWEKSEDKLQGEVDELWRIMLGAGTDKEAHNIICVLDALDECREQDRDRLITLLSKFYMDKSSTAPKQHWLKFLITSRPYEGIKSRFEDTVSHLPLIRLKGEDENAQIHREINLVIEEQVNTLAKKFPLQPDAKARLKNKLLSMEHRTYLWLHLAIECIKETFQNSFRPSEEEIQSLPATVEDAYEQILKRGASRNKDNVFKILKIIVAARRPLTVGEMAVAVGVATSPKLELEVKLGIDKNWLKQQLPQWCGLFVFINHSRIYLIHQTAKEFLVNSTAGIASSNQGWKHCLSHVDVEGYMAHICVGYLARMDLKKLKQLPAQAKKPRDKVRSNELLQETDDPDDIQAFWNYATKHWSAHVRSVQGQKTFLLMDIVCELYNTGTERFQRWFPVFWRAFRPSIRRPEMNAIRLAALNGHSDVLKTLFRTENLDLDAQDGQGRTALIWASELGHDSVVQILLNNGAGINIQGGYYGNALQVASYKGYDSVVQILLNHGAEVNAQDHGEDYSRNYGTALQAASWRGHESMVQMLLRNGAKVNARGGRYGNALQAASLAGYYSVVQMLLSNGAKVNAQSGRYGNVLQAASARGHDSVVQLLLKNGADVNAQGGSYGNALQAASYGGYDSVVQMLLEKGAEVNIQGGEYSNALQAASLGGHDSVVQILLEKGAEVNIQGGEYSNALQAASLGGHDLVVQILLNNGAKVNAQGGRYGNALQAASAGGYDSVVQILLKKGAKVNAQGGQFGNALQAASAGGHDSVVQILLSKGAKVNAQGGEYGNALQAASYTGHGSVLQILLNNGAEVNAEGGFYVNALQAASYKGRDSVAQILLDHGAEVNAQGGEYGNALQAALKRGHHSVVQILLDHGAKDEHPGRKQQEESAPSTLQPPLLPRPAKRQKTTRDSG